ncbi:MAG: CdaR family protein [Planctomycetota bacterium]|jgi:hypothetical protein|nr:CdaR family protein [Planctomycetota bacterium]
MNPPTSTQSNFPSTAPRLTTFLKALLFQDIYSKIMALVCAVVLWFFVYGEVTDKVILDLNIVIWPGGNSLLVEDQSLERISLEFQGPSDTIKKLQASEITRPYLIQESVLGSTETTKAIEIPLSSFLNLPPMVRTVESIKSRFVRVQVTRSMIKTLEVQEKIDGKVASGFRHVRTTFDPTEVRVRGPAEILSTQQQIHTRAISVAGRSQSFSMTIKTIDRIGKSPGRSGRRIFYMEDRPIMATVIIEPMTQEIEIPVRVLRDPNRTASFPYNFKMIDRTVKIRLAGSPEALKETERFIAYVDLTQVDPKQIERELGLGQYFDVYFNLPPGVRLADPSPPRVRMEFLRPKEPEKK